MKGSFSMVGTILCVATTILMLWGVCRMYRIGEGVTSFSFKSGSDIFAVIATAAIFFCIWYTFPFAWARGLPMDPTIIVGAFIGAALFVISGCIESQSAYDERSRRRR